MTTDTIVPELSKTAEQRLKRAGFYGIDASLDVSLFEYGFLLKPEADGEFLLLVFNERWSETIGPKSIPVPVCYGFKRIYQSDIDDAFNASKEGILSFTGMAEWEWLATDITHKVYDIESYSGYLDIRDPVYWQSIGGILRNLNK